MDKMESGIGARGEISGYRVSVVIPTYNRAHYIEECLDSLLVQSMPAHEIIVVDDGSEDDTAVRLAAYGDLIRYIYKQNGGKPSAVNLALTLVEGDLVWLFDDDDVALPDAIKDRLEALRRTPGARFVYSPHYLGADGVNGRIVRGRLHESPCYEEERFFFELMKGCFFHLASALVRTELYREVGPFDSNLLSSEDYDMQIRLARRSTAAFCASPTFIFRQHSGIRGAKTIRYAGTERAKIFRRYDFLVGKKIREALPLGDYLIPRGGLIEGARQRRAALLSRMIVMASKGCVAEMIEDLIAALNTLEIDGRLTPTESHLIEEAIRTGYAYPAVKENWPEFSSRIRALSNYPGGRVALLRLSRGIVGMARDHPGSTCEKMKGLGMAISLLRFLV